MTRVPLKDIRERAVDRPAGYYEDVISRGVVDGDDLLIDESERLKLVAKYNPREPELPSLEVMVKNFWGSLAWWVLKGFPVARRRDFVARLERCQRNECGQWLGDRKVARCAACGCSGLKLWLASEKCPKGYWDAVQGVAFGEAAKEVFKRLSERLKRG